MTALGVVLGCQSRPQYDALRPWEETGGRKIELIQLNDTTRPAIRLSVAEGTAFVSLGPVERGYVFTAVGTGAAQAPEGAVAVRVRAAGTAAGGPPDCLLPLGGEAGVRWRSCRIGIEEAAADAELEISPVGTGLAELFVASPVLVRRAAASRPPVFIFLLDTLRADRLRTFNRRIPLGRALDELAADAIVFERVRSSSSWTRTAVATLFTGLLPHRHKVLDRVDVLAGEMETLPRILQRHGYRTEAWSANLNVLPLWGFAKGFDLFVDAGALRLTKEKAAAKTVLGQVSERVAQNGNQAVFYYVHLMDPHAPYQPDEAHLQQVERSPALVASYPGHGGGEKGQKWSSEYKKYLAEIAGMDDELGVMLRGLKTIGLYDESLILVVADHGEEFYDHGNAGHGKTLYEEVLRIPVWLKLPGQAGKGTRVSKDVSLEDLMPTVLNVLGVPVPEALDGRVVWSDGAVRQNGPPPPQLARLKLDAHDLTSIVDGQWKLIVDQHGNDALFDIEHDPLESENLLATKPEQARRMRELLDALVAREEQGWHVRGCGSDEPAVVRFAVSAPQVRPLLFEADDSLTPPSDQTAGGAVSVTMRLEKHLVAREVFGRAREVFGRIVQATARDEDEIMVPSENGLQQVVVESLDEGDLVYSLGAADDRLLGRAIRLDPLAEATRARASDTVECYPKPAKGTVPSAPYLRIWYVPPSATVADATVDPAVKERLRALGYNW